MAPIDKKRKSAPTNDSFARSRKVGNADDRPAKRPRPEEKDSQGSTAAAKIPQAPKISRVREEEVAFPRGGASVLTPLEHKQIQIEATRDVLFEQGTKSSRVADEDVEVASHGARQQKSKKKGKQGIEVVESEGDSVKIEGLNYKRIVPGSLVLGQVAEINAHDIALSLPNNLTGYVPITSISDKLNERIEALAAAEDTDAMQIDGTSTEDIDLKKLFTIGQYLRAFVVSTSEDGPVTGKSKRRIELSLRPQQSNGGLTPQNVITHNTLMATVESVEDHGLIMNIGYESKGMRGFMSSKEIGQYVQLSDVQEGAVFLCIITGLSPNGKTVKLCADSQKIGSSKRPGYLSEAPTVDAFLPGTLVEILVADVNSRGLVGKVMGMLDVTADLMHSGAGPQGKELEKKYKLGSKIKGRVICTFPSSDPPKLGVSLLDHIVTLQQQQTIKEGEKKVPLDVVPLSAIIEEVTVRKVEPGVGLFVSLGLKGVFGFVHISRVKDGKIETLSEVSGLYKVGSTHRGRVIGYNSLDGVYLLSLEQTVMEQAFLRIEDLVVGQIVKGKVEKIIVNATGVSGVLINLAEGISGLVPETHLADVKLLHPEKRFKESMAVTARVLSVDPGKRQVRLTLKKSLVNSEAAPFISHEQLSVGMQSPGTIVNIIPTGAVVQFYGSLRGFLPVAEMSEAYIQDPSQHFKVGQVVNVHVLRVDPEAQKLTVSCKDPSAFGLAQQNALKKLKIGEVVSALVTEKSSDDVSVEIQDLGLRAVLPVGHLTDGSENRNRSSLKRIRVGQTLTELVVLDKLEQKRVVVLTNKPSLLADAKDRTLLRSFEDVRENKCVHGFVKNITSTAVFVQFGGGLTALLPKTKLSQKAIQLPNFGLVRYQSLQVKVTSVDHAEKRFYCSMIENPATESGEAAEHNSANLSFVNPVDVSLARVDDLKIGKLTKARVTSIKDTQINVQLSDNVQGRIDVSQVFDTWDEIKDYKRPLKTFSPKQVINVRVLGIHDARNHRFLPITHRSGKTLVYELSAKPSDQISDAQEPLTLDKVVSGSSWIAYVNNVGDDCLWVNLSPNVRGRIRALDVSDDVSLLKDLETNFPVGSAIRAHVKGVNLGSKRLDLSARSAQTSDNLTFDNLSKDMVVPGRVTRVDERQIMVQLSDIISAPIHLTDISDDFSRANTMNFAKNDIVRVCITDVDLANRRIRLSTRPSRVLNSSLTVEDPEIFSITQLSVNDVVRGFVKNVADKGLFINLGGNITAYVRVSDLSDSYIKDWKSEFHVDQLITGKVTAVDADMNHIQLSLKASIMNKNYIALLNFDDIAIGQIITGKIRKVEDFGVFIVVDGSANISGLCHQSEMAEKRVHDVKKLYEEGDVVKAKVLKVDVEKKRISFGLKASYFDDVADSEDSDDDMQGVKIGSHGDVEDDEDSEDGIDLDDIESTGSAPGIDDDQHFDQDIDGTVDERVAALNAGGFNWSANVLDQDDDKSNADSDDGTMEQSKKKKRRKAEIKVDRTGDLDTHGPQSVGDFERLLLGQPDSSDLWIQYMALQMKLSELSKARDIAERAIKTINVREDTEKLNLWIALLNLEVAYGTDETVDEVFHRACQYNDAQEIHERLASIYIQSGNHNKADDLFQVIIKKFSQSPAVWSNYAQFLHSTMSSPDRARALLPRATQSLPVHAHLVLTLKFAALEFHSTNGSPERGRTIFEGLLGSFPKRLDIWNQLLDLEIQQGDNGIVRGVFERVVKTKGIKPKGAKAWFRKWSDWEDKNGDKKSQEKVRAKAEEWVRAASEKK